MTDVSVIIPARNEEFLNQTIDNVLSNIELDTEVIVILDGYFPEDFKNKDRVRYIYNAESIGQRAAVNQGAQVSSAKYLMKLDAHCAVGPGFDRILKEYCTFNTTLIPRMYNLHAFDWVCDCKTRLYQGPEPEPCGTCKQRFRKEIRWIAKHNPETDAMLFDSDMKFGYWRDFKNRPEGKGDLVPSLGALGACFFMHADRFWELEGLDEGHGGWGQFGTEMSCKSWLSGGRQLICTKTWFSHMFRTGHGFGFPYKISGRQTSHARKYSQDLWLNDRWKGQIYPLRWLIEKFAPVPTWDEKAISRIKGSDYKPGTGEIWPGFKTFQNVGNTIEVPASLNHKNVNKKEYTVKKITEGIVYYTDNKLEERIANICRENLIKAAGQRKIVSVSQLPINLGSNIVFGKPPSVLSMFEQILVGLENVGTDVVFFCEHDVLYHPSHFDFTPVDPEKFYYNQNNWKVDSATGEALFYYCKQTLGVCVHTKVAIEHYRKRVERVKKEGFKRSMGFEPGTHKAPRGFDQTESDVYFSRFPNVDIRHTTNLTGKRFRKEQYRNKSSIKGWTLADEIPFWGRTKDRFDEWIKESASKI